MVNSQAVEGKVDWKGRPAKKKVHGGILPSFCILVMFALNSCAWVGIAANLITYFTGTMHIGLAAASNTLTNFMGSSYILALLGAYLADAHVGRCRIVLVSACIGFLGLSLLTVQAHFPSLRPPACDIYDSKSHCEEVHGDRAALLFISLYSLAVGMAGVFAGLPPHGADQFDESDPQESRLMSNFFNCLTGSNALGSILSLTLVVWVQTKLGWDWGFGVSAGALLLGTLIFVSCIPRYRIHVVQGTNPIVDIIQVLAAAIRNRRLPLPNDPSKLYEIDRELELEVLPHRDIFRFLDKAAIKRSSQDLYSPTKQSENNWTLCRVTQVENTKTIVGLLPIFACSIFMSTCLAQLQTFTVQQGLTMNSRVTGDFHLAPANLALAPTIFMVVSLPIYDRLVVPFFRRFTGHPAGITNLQRIGVGLLLACTSMMVAAVVEAKRKKVAESHGMRDTNPLTQPLPISIVWLALQHFIFGISDMFTYVGLIEFFYSEAPKSMKSIATSFLWCSLGVGYLLSSVLVQLVNLVTRNNTKSGGWLAGNNLNKNHLDLFYLLLAVLTFLDFLNYLFWACRYKYKQQPNVVSS